MSYDPSHFDVLFDSFDIPFTPGVMSSESAEYMCVGGGNGKIYSSESAEYMCVGGSAKQVAEEYVDVQIEGKEVWCFAKTDAGMIHGKASVALRLSYPTNEFLFDGGSRILFDNGEVLTYA